MEALPSASHLGIVQAHNQPFDRGHETCQQTLCQGFPPHRLWMVGQASYTRRLGLHPDTATSCILQLLTSAAPLFRQTVNSYIRHEDFRLPSSSVRHAQGTPPDL